MNNSRRSFPNTVQVLDAIYGGDIAKAVTTAVSFLNERPDDIPTIRRLARVFDEGGSGDEAALYWSRLRSLEPADLEANFHCAKTAIAAGADVGAALGGLRSGDEARLRPVLEPLLSSPPPPAPASRARHVAIAGVSYCGSTLMDRLLGGLPGVRSIGESHWLIETYAGAKGKLSIDFADPSNSKLTYCTVCGQHCPVLTLEFRRGLAVDRSNWYFRIAEQLGTDILISADKNPPKLIEHDPLLRMDLLVLFKSPAQAWASQLDKLPKDEDPDYYLEALERYISQWCRAYEIFEKISPKGKTAFISFDRFVEEPRETLALICAALDLPFDESVLQRTVPGHAIGGNRRAMARLREHDYAMDILPLPAPKFPREQVRLLAASSRMSALHERMLARFEALETARRHQCDAPVSSRGGNSTIVAA